MDETLSAEMQNKVTINNGKETDFISGDLALLFDDITVTKLAFGKVELNGSDIKAIMALSSTLKYLDMTNASIVEGGEAYYDASTTIANVIGADMFREMKKLETVLLPVNIEEIQQWAFADCPLLTSYNIPEGVKSFGKGVFNGAHMVSITLPASLDTGICNYSCGSLGYLENIIVSNDADVKSEKGVVYSKDGKELIFFPRNRKTFDTPSSVTTLRKFCLDGALLTSLYLPRERFYTIESRAIMRTTLTALTIPDSVITMESEAIFENQMLETVNVEAIDPPFNEREEVIIRECQALKAIFVPEESVNDYKSALEWRDYSKIIKPIMVFVPVMDIMLDKSALSLNIGDKEFISTTVIPITATNKDITWSSSNPEVVVVDEITGEIASIGAGIAVIAATTVDGGKTASCSVEVMSIAVADVIINKTVLSLIEGEKEVLVADVTPGNATNPKVTWKSGNPKVATVNKSGEISALKGGTATITVTTVDGGKIAKCTVTVLVSVTGVTLDKTAFSFNVGDKDNLRATVVPSTAANNNVSWSTSDSGVATVDASGTVTAVGAGMVTITATTADGGKTASCSVTVLVPVTGVTLDKTAFSLNVGGKDNLRATVVPSTAANKNVSWSTSDSRVATVDASGTVTAIGAGMVTITATTADGGKTASCSVTVLVPVTGVVLDKITLLLNVGTKGSLQSSIVPATASNKNISWSTSNSGVVTVNAAGEVFALKEGTANIIVTTADGGKMASCSVRVLVPVVGVTFDKATLLLNVGAKSNLVATITPTTASNKNISWSTSDSRIATVGLAGEITAIGKGSATITATTVDGSKTAKCTVTVLVPVTGVTLDKAALSLNVGTTGILKAIVTPSLATNTGVNWSTSNSNIAKVSAAGVVTAVGGGTATITATTIDGNKMAKCTVTVLIPVTSIMLNKRSLSLVMGERETLIATITPANATNRSIKWSSDNVAVATVNATTGEVITNTTGIAGSITISAIADGKTITCVVTVAKCKVSIDGGSMEEFIPGNLLALLNAKALVKASTGTIEKNVVSQIKTISAALASRAKTLIFGRACLNGTDIKAIMALNTTLTSLNMSEVTMIEGGEVYYPSSVAPGIARRYEISDHMFCKMTKLQTVLLPKNTKNIRQLAFNECPLTSYNIPEGVIYFRHYAFSGSTVTSVTLPVSLDAEQCDYSWGALGRKLVQINVAPNNPKIKTVNGIVFSKDGKMLFFFPRNKSTTYSVPGDVTTLKKSCFDGAILTSLTLPASLTTIEACAISYAKVTSLTIPAGVVKMDRQAIFCNQSLKTVIMMPTVPPVRISGTSSIIDSCSALTTIYVRKVCLELYKKAPGWSEHASKFVIF